MTTSSYASMMHDHASKNQKSPADRPASHSVATWLTPSIQSSARHTESKNNLDSVSFWHIKLIILI
jgi:hypothetical protein